MRAVSREHTRCIELRRRAVNRLADQAANHGRRSWAESRRIAAHLTGYVDYVLTVVINVALHFVKRIGESGDRARAGVGEFDAPLRRIAAIDGQCGASDVRGIVRMTG